MKYKAIYEFIGDTEFGLGYVNGKEYDLQVTDRTLLNRIIGLPFGAPFSWKVIITKPIVCPYSSRAKFYENWKFKYTELSDE